MKLAIVNQRYGLEVNGGSEYYTRLLAEHMAKYHEVDVLTTKAMDHDTWSNIFEQDEELIHGIKVRRFEVKKERTDAFRRIDRIRYHFPWKSRLIEKKWIYEQGPYTPDLIKYIERHTDEYDLFLFVTYLYYPAAVGIEKVRKKAIMIPTAHDEPYIYMKCYKENFTNICGLIYLTPEERGFVQGVFHNEMIPSEVVAIGVEEPVNVSPDRFREKYQLDKPYLIYAGRVEESKGCNEMFSYYENISKELDIDLVVMGKCNMLSEIPNDSRIHMLGFVSEEDKMDGISGAVALILPSPFESLSIAVLEAMSVGTPVIVNGKCEVLRGHCHRSNGAGRYYMDEKDFKDCIIEYSRCDRDKISRKAKEYIQKEYTWESVEKKLNDFLERCTCKED